MTAHLLDGRLEAGGVRLDPGSSALRHGAGFFETIRLSGWSVLHLKRHLERLTASPKAYGLPAPAWLPGEADLLALAEELGLAGGEARLNAALLYDDLDAPPRCLATAAAYHPPGPEAERSLALSPWRQTSHLGGHKSASYLHYLLAGRAARHAGADDALLLDHGGRLLETTTSALVVADGTGRLLTPESAFALPSVSLALARGALGIGLAELTPDSLRSAERVYCCNSLTGMLPVTRIDLGDGEILIFGADHAACRTANGVILRP
ncbi:aminotransferase class IV [Desulfohalovibrio reitneri]|uniref:aminotransferase class IV n=1 Tax=Desulfohalovibrio reitneri TaxID=1307759 RepID=UPI00068AD54A|nr:aminotransferase class IV [Desulfohalovibrio reitneri]